MKRREFLKSMAVVGALPLLPACFSAKAYRANGKVRLAAIGVGAQAWHDLKQFAKNPDICEIVALCDTDIGAKHTLEALKTYPNLPRFQDFRKMFDAMDGRIDAVLVGTPDFSHFPCTMEAIRRGIPVYVEKPLAHTFEECELLMQAEKKYGVICQMGNQGHSGNNYFQFKEYVEKGVFDLSKLTKLVAHMNNPRRWHKWNGNVTKFPTGEALPKDLDWDTWLATAQYHAYSKDYVQGEWRSWFDFGNGCLGDWGAHTFDTMHRFFRLGLPTKVTIKDVEGWNPYVFPMQDTLVYDFAADGNRPAIKLEWYEGVKNLPTFCKDYKYLVGGAIPPSGAGTSAKKGQLMPGKYFELSDGTAWEGASHGNPIVRCGESNEVPEYPYMDLGFEAPELCHYRSFLRAVRGEEKTKSPFSVSGPLAEVFCLGCIAQRLNRSFAFDPVKKQVVGDEVANALLKGAKGTPRKGWEEFYRV